MTPAISLTIDVILLIVLIGYLIWGKVDETVQVLDFNMYRFRLLVRGSRSIYEGLEVVSIDFKFIIALLIIWMVISIIFDLIRVTDGFGSGMYTQMLASGNSYLRWIEYALGLSVMLFIIGVLAGVKEFDNIYLILAANVVVMFQLNSIEIFQLQSMKTTPVANPDAIGQLTNNADPPDANWYGWFVSSLSQYVLTSVIVYVIFKDLLVQNGDLVEAGSRTPDWVWVVVLTGLVLYIGITVTKGIELYYRSSASPSYNLVYDGIYLLMKLVITIGILVGLSS